VSKPILMFDCKQKKEEKKRRGSGRNVRGKRKEYQ
jgi:hypothetical protein